MTPPKPQRDDRNVSQTPSHLPSAKIPATPTIDFTKFLSLPFELRHAILLEASGLNELTLQVPAQHLSDSIKRILWFLDQIRDFDSRIAAWYKIDPRLKDDVVELMKLWEGKRKAWDDEAARLYSAYVFGAAPTAQGGKYGS